MRAADLYEAVAELTRRGTPFVLATVTEVRGSSPRGVGAKMVVLEDGDTIETVGGGPLEERVIADALDCLASGSSRSEVYGLREKGERALGTICGGEVSIFLEAQLPERTVLCVGGGHVGRAVAACAASLDFRVAVLDSREEMLNAQSFPKAALLILGEPADTAALFPLTGSTSVVIVTHSHRLDEAALRAVVGSPAGYVGMIGSTAKVRTIKERLQGQGVQAEALARVHAPVGLDIGAETPAEIALSIMAEIVACDRGARATSSSPERGEAP